MNYGTIPQNWVAVPLLRGLVIALSTQTPISHLVSIHVRVCCEQSMNETGFPQTYQFPFSVSFHQSIISTHLFIRDTIFS